MAARVRSRRSSSSQPRRSAPDLITSRLRQADPKRRQALLDELLHRGLHLSLLDSDDLVLHLESRAEDWSRLLGLSKESILNMLETEHKMLLEQVRRHHPEVLGYIREHIHEVKEQLELNENEFLMP